MEYALLIVALAAISGAMWLIERRPKNSGAIPVAVVLIAVIWIAWLNH